MGGAVIASVGMSVLVLCSGPSVLGQSAAGVQPIVLTATTTPCQSPAVFATQPMRGYEVTAGHAVPVYATAIPLTPQSPSASDLVPLPAVQPWRGYDSSVTTVVERPIPSEYLYPGPTVQVYPPAPVPTVPDGYTVRRGLIGQPVLYKSGQPVRNFFRYLSP